MVAYSSFGLMGKSLASRGPEVMKEGTSTTQKKGPAGEGTQIFSRNVHIWTATEFAKFLLLASG